LDRHKWVVRVGPIFNKPVRHEKKVQHCRTQEVKIGPKEPEMVRHEL
jgi:hypothetical protein